MLGVYLESGRHMTQVALAEAMAAMAAVAAAAVWVRGAAASPCGCMFRR